MKTMTSSNPASIPREPALCNEVYMQHSLFFSNSLKDLKNLRTELYSAAEYFELTYTNDDDKQIVVDSLKDYAIKALVNTVDHLGSVTYEVNDLLDEKVVEVSGTEFRVSCIEQRLQTCQEHIDREGLSQQSLVINTPKYYKQYILPVEETINDPSCTNSRYPACSLEDVDHRHQFRNVAREDVQATIREIPSSRIRKERLPSPSPPPLQQSTFLSTGSMPKKELEKKRTISPRRFPHLDSGSLSSRPTTPNSRATTPNPCRPTTTTNSFVGGHYAAASEPRKSASMRLRPGTGKEKPHEIEQYPSKSKRLLKALLGRRKSKKDDMLYAYLDEY